jgi:hypothetical protein
VVVVVVVVVVSSVVPGHRHGASGPQHHPSGRMSLGSVHDTSEESPTPVARTNMKITIRCMDGTLSDVLR